MARERYLINAGEDTIHDPNAEKKALQKENTPKGKWQNFWFYHKWHVVIAVFVLLIAAYSIVSAVNTVKPDYEVGMLVAKMYPDSVTEALGNEMEKYGKDRNGDGKVTVQVDQYYIPLDGGGSASGPASSSAGGIASGVDPQIVIANQTKFIGDINTGSCILFLTDDASFLSQEKSGNHIFAYLDGKTPQESATDYEKMRLPLLKTKLRDVTLPVSTITGSTTVRAADLLGDTSFSLRTYYGTSIEDKEKDYYEASKELLEKLKDAS